MNKIVASLETQCWSPTTDGWNEMVGNVTHKSVWEILANEWSRQVIKQTDRDDDRNSRSVTHHDAH